MQERRALWYGIEMKALDPYISSMTKEDGLELKKKLATSYFSGHRRLDQSESKSRKNEKINDELLETILKLIDKVN